MHWKFRSITATKNYFDNTKKTKFSKLLTVPCLQKLTNFLLLKILLININSIEFFDKSKRIAKYYDYIKNYVLKPLNTCLMQN